MTTANHEDYYDAKDFCKYLVYQLASDGLKRIPLKGGGAEKGFKKALDVISEKYNKISKADKAYEYLAIVAYLNPNSNTGSYDRFWETLRKLQPGPVQFGNPEYCVMEINADRIFAREELKSIKPEWGPIIKKAAKAIEAVVNNE